MNIALQLAGRNLRLFFRDRLNVFFSLLSALILFLIYALFLSSLQVTDLTKTYPQIPVGDIKGFVDAWVFAGIVTITTLTTGLGALSVFVEDSATGRFKDFLVSPVRRWQLVVGYLISSYVVAIIMTTIVLVISQLYILSKGHAVMTTAELGQCYGYVFIIAAMFSGLSGFIVTFIKSTGAFSSLSTIVGTVLGFFAAAYIPAGSMPSGVVNFLNALPFAQAAILIRQPFTAHYVTVLSGGDNQAANGLRSYFGISGAVNSHMLSNRFILLVFVFILIIFLSLSISRIRNKIQ